MAGLAYHGAHTTFAVAAGDTLDKRGYNRDIAALKALPVWSGADGSLTLLERLVFPWHMGIESDLFPPRPWQSWCGYAALQSYYWHARSTLRQICTAFSCARTGTAQGDRTNYGENLDKLKG